MHSCGSPNRTYSMMDEFTEDMEHNHCYVNPFVGEGNYARYLRTWLQYVPKRQILLINFDDLSANAAGTMEKVANFLKLAPFAFDVKEAHNTHKARSVHVAKAGASAIEET